jgi:hypothetical protein
MDILFKDDVAAILPLGVSLMLFGHNILLTLFTSSGKATVCYNVTFVDVRIFFIFQSDRGFGVGLRGALGQLSHPVPVHPMLPT